MNCTKPFIKLKTGITNPKTGKEILINLPKEYRMDSLDEIREKFKEDVITIPCGKCESCKINYRNEWATRLVNEKDYHKEALFLTLTYEKNPKLKKQDIKEFIKKLKIKTYLAAGEYGEKTGRAHWHAIIYSDEEIDDVKRNNTLNRLESKKISKAWEHGFVEIGECNEASANYTCGYTIKKAGETNQIIMSPGIGRKYALDNLERLKTTNNIIINGRKKPLPRYYKKIIEKTLTEEEIKKRNEEFTKIRTGKLKERRNENDLTKPDEMAYLKHEETKIKRKEVQKNRNMDL